MSLCCTLTLDNFPEECLLRATKTQVVHMQKKLTKFIFLTTCLTDLGAAAGDDEGQKGFFLLLSLSFLCHSLLLLCEKIHINVELLEHLRRNFYFWGVSGFTCQGSGSGAAGADSVRRGGGCPTPDTAGSSQFQQLHH